MNGLWIGKEQIERRFGTRGRLLSSLFDQALRHDRRVMQVDGFEARFNSVGAAMISVCNRPQP